MPRKPRPRKSDRKSPTKAKPVETFAPEKGVREVDTDYGLKFRIHKSMVQVVHIQSNALIFETGQLNDERVKRFIEVADETLRAASKAWSLKTESAIQKWMADNRPVFQQMNNTLRVYR